MVKCLAQNPTLKMLVIKKPNKHKNPDQKKFLRHFLSMRSEIQAPQFPHLYLEKILRTRPWAPCQGAHYKPGSVGGSKRETHTILPVLRENMASWGT